MCSFFLLIFLTIYLNNKKKSKKLKFVRKFQILKLKICSTFEIHLQCWDFNLKIASITKKNYENLLSIIL